MHTFLRSSQRTERSTGLIKPLEEYAIDESVTVSCRDYRYALREAVLSASDVLL